MAISGSFTLETNVTPPISLDVSSAQGEPSLIAQWLQPRLSGAVMGVPLDYAPYGQPAAGLGTALAVVLGILIIVGAITIVRALAR